MEILTKAAVLGVSTGLYCTGFCLPVLFPLMCTTSSSSVCDRLVLLLKFSAGRLIAYLTIGAIAGLLGQKAPAHVLHAVTAASYLILSMLLIGYSTSHGAHSSKTCASFLKLLPDGRFTMLAGLLLGLHLCPPFLLAITHVFQSAQVAKGMLFFLVFFIVTSAYFIPFLVIGQFAGHESVRWIARTSALLAGGIFFWMGLNQMIAVVIGW